MVMGRSPISQPQRVVTPTQGSLLRQLEREREKTECALAKLPTLGEIVLAGSQKELTLMDRAIGVALSRIQEEQTLLRASRARALPTSLVEMVDQRKNALGCAVARVTDLANRADAIKVSLTSIPTEVPPIKAEQQKELLEDFRRLRWAYWEKLHLIPLVQKETIAAIQSVVVDGRTLAARLHVGGANGAEEHDLREAVKVVHDQISTILERIGDRRPRAPERLALAKLLMRFSLDPDDLNELFHRCLEKRERLADLEIGIITTHRSFRAAERAGDPRYPEWRELVEDLGGTALQARASMQELQALYQPYQRVKQYIAAANHRFVCSWVLRRQPPRLWREDLMQEGMIGLMRAIEKFDVGSGLSLLTYASYWVFQKATREREKLTSSVVVPGYQQKILKEMRQEVASTTRRSDEEIAQALGADVRDVRSLRPLVSGVGSLDVETPRAAGRTVRDFVLDHRVVRMESGVEQEIRHQTLQAALTELSPREREVIIDRFGLNGEPPRTLVEIGQRLGLTRERVRQIEAKALQRLRCGGSVNVLKNLFEETFD